MRETLLNKVCGKQQIKYITGTCYFTEVFNKTENSAKLELKSTVDILPRTF